MPATRNYDTAKGTKVPILQCQASRMRRSHEASRAQQLRMFRRLRTAATASAMANAIMAKASICIMERG